MSRRGARAAVVVGVLAILAIPAGAASAHPLGNFTTNAYAGLVVAPDGVTVDYVVDLAEVPALRLAQQIDAEAGGRERYPAEECARLAAGLDLTVAGATTPLAVDAADLTFPPGEAGLDTARLECRLAIAVDVGGAVTLADANHADRAGWREVTATGDGTTLVSSDVPAASISDRLRAYPEDRLASPLDVRSAALEVRDGQGAPAGGGSGLGAAVVPGPVGRGLDRFSTAFTDLVARQDLTTGVGLAGVLLAVALGGLHAVAPGHGKTVMAAVLVGRDGSGRQALALGLTVAVAHTLGVVVLGAVFTVVDVVSPDRVFAWLGVASGLLFALVGVTLLRAARARRGHVHHHDGHPGHQGHHDGHPGHQGHDHAVPGAGVRWRQLVAPGLAGGLVPSPSALLVLLGGLALGRAWFGLLLVVAYGLGMAAVLVGAGYALLRARGRILDRLSAGGVARITTALPVATASLVVVAGLTIAVRAAVTAL